MTAHSRSSHRRSRWLILTLLVTLLWVAPARAGLNQWTSNGPEGGAILSLAVNPLTPATLYASTNGGGVFRSQNGAGTWSAVNTGLTNRIVNALAIDPQSPATAYAGGPGGVFKTTNAGASWTAVNVGLLQPGDIPFPVFSLAVDPQAPATVYAGTTIGVFKSTDGGAIWVL